jgi:hypothetical protein
MIGWMDWIIPTLSHWDISSSLHSASLDNILACADDLETSQPILSIAMRSNVICPNGLIKFHSPYVLPVLFNDFPLNNFPFIGESWHGMPLCQNATMPCNPLPYPMGMPCVKHSYISVCCESYITLSALYLTPILDPFKILIHS